MRICSRKFLLLLHISVANLCCWVGSVLGIASSHCQTGSAVDKCVLRRTMQKEANNQCPATALMYMLLVVQMALTFTFILVTEYVLPVHVSELLWNLCRCGFWPQLSSQWHNTELAWMNVWTAIFTEDRSRWDILHSSVSACWWNCVSVSSAFPDTSWNSAQTK